MPAPCKHSAGHDLGGAGIVSRSRMTVDDACTERTDRFIYGLSAMGSAPENLPTPCWRWQAATSPELDAWGAARRPPQN